MPCKSPLLFYYKIDPSAAGCETLLVFFACLKYIPLESYEERVRKRRARQPSFCADQFYPHRCMKSCVAKSVVML